MLNHEQLIFLRRVLTAKNAQGGPVITVGVEAADIAASTFREIDAQLENFKEVPPA